MVVLWAPRMTAPAVAQLTLVAVAVAASCEARAAERYERC